MTMARRDIVDDHQIGIFHCQSRCVRRSWLHGIDPYSGKDYSHRKQWIEDRLKFLSGVFAVDVISFAVLSNHVHDLVRTRPDVAKTWSPEEVARRWLILHPKRKKNAGPNTDTDAHQWTPLEPQQEDIDALARNPDRIEILRTRLASLSWFMAKRNEYIARRANAEDGCKGRFFEGRFEAQAVLDEAGLLLCLVYVDLNLVRARLALSIEDSEHTGAYLRVLARQAMHKLSAVEANDERKPAPQNPQTLAREKQEDASTPHAKAPIASTDPEITSSASRELTPTQREMIQHQQERLQSANWLTPIDCRNASSPAAGLEFNAGVLPMTDDEYLAVADFLGKQYRHDKPGAIPAHLKPILERFSIDIHAWVSSVKRYGSLFWRVVGRAERITAAAAKAGKRWFKGVRTAAALST